MRASSTALIAVIAGLVLPALAAAQDAPLYWMRGEYEVEVWIPANPPGPDFVWVGGTYSGELTIDNETLIWRHETEHRGRTRQSHGIYGWNAATEVYDMSYVEPGSDGILQLTGRYDADNSQLIGRGMMTNEFGATLNLELVVTFESPDRFRQELFMVREDDRRTTIAQARYKRPRS